MQIASENKFAQQNTFSTDVSPTFKPQPKKQNVFLTSIPFDDIFVESEFIKKNQAEFESFMIKNKATSAGYNGYMQENQAFSEFSTSKEMIRSPIVSKRINYSKSRKTSSIVNSFEIKPKTAPNNLTYDTLYFLRDKEKLKQILNSLVAQTKRKEAYLQSLKDEHTQLKNSFQNSNVFYKIQENSIYEQEDQQFLRSARMSRRISYFQDSQSYYSQQNSPRSPRKFRRKLSTFNSEFGFKPPMFMRNLSNMKNNDIGSVLNTSHRKNEPEQKQNKQEFNYSKNSMQNLDVMELKQLHNDNTITQSEMHFNIIELEFQKVGLLNRIERKLQELQEAQDFRTQLQYQIEQESRQKIFNEKKLNELHPTLDEYQKLQEHFKRIEFLSKFRKIVVLNLLKQRREQIKHKNKTYQDIINKKLNGAQSENKQLHYLSKILEERQIELQMINHSISNIKQQRESLTEVQIAQYQQIQRKNLEHKTIRVLKALTLIMQLEAFKKQHKKRIIQTEDNEIFFELQIAANQLTVYNCRNFGVEIMQNEEEYNKFIEIDKKYQQILAELPPFDPNKIISIYNQNQFDITSLQGQHQLFMEQKDCKTRGLQDLINVKQQLGRFSKDIVSYLRYKEIMKNTKIEKTLADLYFHRSLNDKIVQIQAEINDMAQLMLSVKFLISLFFDRLQTTSQLIYNTFYSEYLNNEFDVYLISEDNDDPSTFKRQGHFDFTPVQLSQLSKNSIVLKDASDQPRHSQGSLGSNFLNLAVRQSLNEKISEIKKKKSEQITPGSNKQSSFSSKQSGRSNQNAKDVNQNIINKIRELNKNKRISYVAPVHQQLLSQKLVKKSTFIKIEQFQTSDNEDVSNLIDDSKAVFVDDITAICQKMNKLIEQYTLKISLLQNHNSYSTLKYDYDYYQNKFQKDYLKTMAQPSKISSEKQPSKSLITSPLNKNFQVQFKRISKNQNQIQSEQVSVIEQQQSARLNSTMNNTVATTVKHQSSKSLFQRKINKIRMFEREEMIFMKRFKKQLYSNNESIDSSALILNDI